MSMLHASSAKRKFAIYFKNPETVFEHFMNKMWIERENVFEEKKNFVVRANKKWDTLTAIERSQYISTVDLPSTSKNTITGFLKPEIDKRKKKDGASKTIVDSVVSDSCTTILSQRSVNVVSALENREQYLTERELVLVESALLDIGVKMPQTFLKEDIKNDETFVKCLTNFVYAWDNFSTFRRLYLEGRSKERKTKLSASLDTIVTMTKEVKDYIERLSIKINRSQPAILLSQIYFKRAEIVTKLIYVMDSLTAKVRDSYLLANLKRRIAQQSTPTKHLSIRKNDELFEVFCENNTQLTWESVYSDLADSHESNFNHKGVSAEELNVIAETFEKNFCFNLKELPFDVTSEKLRMIVKLMPVLHISRKDVDLLINLHEFVYTPGVFEAIFLKKDCDVNEEENIELNEDEPTNQPSIRNRGRQPSVISKFPEIVDAVAEFVKQHGFAAQSRKRDETAYPSGVTISQIQEHLYSKFPALKDHRISLSTIRRMFEAPNIRNLARERYAGLIDTKVGRKQNSYREPHVDAHYLFARNKLRREFAVHHSKDVTMISVDDMAKIKVGAPTVSRYHQIRSIFMNNDSPNLPDHDFLVPGYLLNVSGYMFLESKNQDISDEDVSDEDVSDEGVSDEDVSDEDVSDEDVSDEYVSDGLTNASVYNKEPNIRDMPQTDFDCMKIEGPIISMFAAICRQVELHLNVKMNEKQVEEIIYEKLDGNRDADASLILKTASSIFNCKIVKFKSNNQFEVVDSCNTNHFEPSLYIFASDVEDEFQSVVFKSQDETEFRDQFLSDYRGNMVHDNLGRLHLPTPYSGKVNLFLRADNFNSSTIATHVSDLHRILFNHQCTSAMIIAHGGADYTPASIVNTLFYYRLFKELNFDLFTVLTYPARYSAFNPIGRVWSPMSNHLADVIFSPKLDGDSKPPCEQSNLSDNEKKEKEKAVFDEALGRLAGYWQGASFNGFEVQNSKILCGEDELIWKDHDSVKKFFKAPLRDLHQHSTLSKECKAMFNHLDRHLNEVVFVRCQDRRCCSEWRSQEIEESLAQNEFRLPAPSLSKLYDGHYETYLCSLSESLFTYDHSLQPSIKTAGLGKCEFCPSFFFKSKSGKDRHLAMFHRRQKRAHPKTMPCVVCGKMFSSLSCLNRHRQSEQHDSRTLRQQQQQQQQPAKKRKTKKQTPIDFLLATSGSTVIEDDADEECNSAECVIASLKNAVVKWVCCEKCEKWYHSKCVSSLANKTAKQLKKIDFFCC